MLFYPLLHHRYPGSFNDGFGSQQHPSPYVRCPFTYEWRDQKTLHSATTEQMAEHCESLHRKYAKSTDTAVRSFIQLPIADMAFHVKYSLDTEYQLCSPYQRVSQGIPGPRRVLLA